MVGTRLVNRILTLCALVLAVAIVAAPAFAQTGQVKGRVVDAENKPVDGAKVTVQQTDTNSKFDLKTNKKGEYMQIGVPPGTYKIVVEKDGLTSTKTQRIGLDMAEVNFTLKKGGDMSEMSKEDRAKAEAKVAGIKAAYAEAAALANAGKYDEAIAKFNEVIGQVPKCTECYIGIGAANREKKDYAASEAAYRKALEIDPNYIEAFSGLANIFNDQKKFTEARAMSDEASKRAGAAGGAGNADMLYNAGVISWNANDFAKAGEQFTAAVAANPNHAESHFMLGQVYLNLGKLPDAAKEFETYTKIAPNGPNAAKAKSNFDMLKAYIK
jgi:tetratricopeptide (TPR) repeat protein